MTEAVPVSLMEKLPLELDAEIEEAGVFLIARPRAASGHVAADRDPAPAIDPAQTEQQPGLVGDRLQRLPLQDVDGRAVPQRPPQIQGPSYGQGLGPIVPHPLGLGHQASAGRQAIRVRSPQPRLHGVREPQVNLRARHPDPGRQREPLAEREAPPRLKPQGMPHRAGVLRQRPPPVRGEIHVVIHHREPAPEVIALRARPREAERPAQAPRGNLSAPGRGRHVPGALDVPYGQRPRQPRPQLHVQPGFHLDAPEVVFCPHAGLHRRIPAPAPGNPYPSGRPRRGQPLPGRPPAVQPQQQPRQRLVDRRPRGVGLGKILGGEVSIGDGVPGRQGEVPGPVQHGTPGGPRDAVVQRHAVHDQRGLAPVVADDALLQDRAHATTGQVQGHVEPGRPARGANRDARRRADAALRPDGHLAATRQKHPRRIIARPAAYPAVYPDALCAVPVFAHRGGELHNALLIKAAYPDTARLHAGGANRASIDGDADLPDAGFMFGRDAVDALAPGTDLATRQADRDVASTLDDVAVRVGERIAISVRAVAMPGIDAVGGDVIGVGVEVKARLNSQTKCNTLLRCCHGTRLYAHHP